MLNPNSHCENVYLLIYGGKLQSEEIIAIYQKFVHVKQFCNQTSVSKSKLLKKIE